MPRYLKKSILKDLSEKMVLLGGPRQVGKTTLALELLKTKDEEHPAYLNWDFPDNRKKIIAGIIPRDEKLIVFDEIHKYSKWRNLLKGIYDKNKSRHQFLVTGSARLDYYRRGGDSLQGRYHFLRLHPFSLFEVSAHPKFSDLQLLLKFGGFPEPFVKQEEVFWKRWQRERTARVLQEDLINLENVKNISNLDLLSSLLPSKVGSQLSINSLREDLFVAHETVESWIKIFENLFYCFRISPYGSSNINATKKEKKLYMWDWSLCDRDGAKLENLLASNLLKYCHFHEDTTGDEYELRYLRDKEKREIDFVVLKNKKPIFAVECKSGESRVSDHIKYFSQRTPIPVFYQVHLGSEDYENLDLKVRVMPLIKFCSTILKI